MISYGPFGDPVRAKNGLSHLISNKLGITRAENMGIVWQDGGEVQFLQQAKPYPNGYSELMHITADHVRKPAPKADDISGLGLAWNAVNVASDAVFTYMSYTAFTAAIGVAIDAVAVSGVAAGAVFMLGFLGIEAIDAAALVLADGIMTMMQAIDRATGADYAQNVKDSPIYNFIETWGPIIALPAVARDIFLAFNIPRDARLLSELRTQMISRAKEVLREMRAVDAFIGADGDIALHDSYAFLKKSVHEIRENLVDVRRDFQKLAQFGLPADAVGVVNDIVHWHEIADGVMADLTAMDIWLAHGASDAGRTMGQWFGSVGSWLDAGTARAGQRSPPVASSAYQAARFGGMYNTSGNARLKVTSLFPITMHLIGGTHAKALKAGR